MYRLNPTLGLALLLLASPALLAAGGAADVPASFLQGPNELSFEPLVTHDGGVLTITGPQGFVSRQSFSATSDFRFEVSNGMADGLYRYELVLTPKLDAATRRALAQARANDDDSVVLRLQAEGKLPAEAQVVSGYFTLAGGAIVPNDLQEERGAAGGPASGGASAGLEAVSQGSRLTNTSEETVISGDLTVYNSLCVGFDCLSAESYGSDTIRLKENNLRIHFDDTSNSPFPNRDWRLVINDTFSGGANRFSIEDSSGGATPFTVEGGAAGGSLYVDTGGRIGFGTSTPVVNNHIVSGNTPTLRLEQNGSSGFAPQTWDLAGNETSLFIRDATNGSTLPFRLRPGAPSSSIDIAADGDVGMGTTSPGTALHVRRTNGNAGAIIEEAGTTEAVRDMLQLINNGRPRWRMQDTSADGQILTVRLSEGQLDFSFSANPGDEVEMFQNGNMTIAGTLTQNSDRDKKHNIVPVAQEDVLTKVMQLPIATWQYLKDDPGVTHLGPMAQDFHALFGLGVDNRHIATVDTAGVALAAIQALGQKLEAKQSELEELKAQNTELLKRLEALEAKLAP
ncbi:MAG: tail fiber domain-containing protein [Acidobacteria bacterium]|nr:tail fiber domain-containing protein [Acidobacteriota bacterium]